VNNGVLILVPKAAHDGALRSSPLMGTFLGTTWGSEGNHCADDGAGSLELELSGPGWGGGSLGVPGAPEKPFLLEAKNATPMTRARGQRLPALRARRASTDRRGVLIPVAATRLSARASASDTARALL
jgi:hypothetical protein